ncbi:MAG: ferredoxin [Candidatus Thiodiazotropha sp. (ex Codakia rugifera)]|nr:ferredoxin [Candidatus Thiodiazotropha sp. (ex Codakia rugifera)]
MTITTHTNAEDRSTQLPGNDSGRPPSLPMAVKDAKATRELMFILRHFHLGDPAAREQLESIGNDYLPALLDPYRDVSRLRYDYPLFLFPPHAEERYQTAEELACPLSQWFQQVLMQFAPGENEARVLKDHLPWLEHHIRKLLQQREGPVDAGATLAESSIALQAHLDLPEQDQQRLSSDMNQLLQVVPEGGQLLSYGRYPALHLLIHAVRSQAAILQSRFQQRINRCVSGLNKLLEVEWIKSDESIEPKMARDSVGLGGELFDPVRLSAVMDHSRGSQTISERRRERIEYALKIMEDWEPDPVLVRFLHIGTLTDPWVQEVDFCQEITDRDPCAKAMEIFDREAEKLTSIFSAVRIAELDIEGIYNPELHNPWFANFSWEAFSQDELRMVPSVIALGSADQVAGEGLRTFSRLLSSGRPIQILIRVLAHADPGAGLDGNPFQSFRTELSYLGISHRQAVVDQSSAARHQHLLKCYLMAMDATRTSLHVINTGLRPPGNLLPLNAWLVAGSAIESRAHPFFRINPEAGDSASVRMDFSDNPQADCDWPLHPFQYLDDNGSNVTIELAFTFADHALLIERLRDHFRVIPPGCDSEGLVSIQDYLTMSLEEAYKRVPFVWAIDGNAILHRLVISRSLALACRDRLNYWHTLQEMAGVRNRYVDMAVEETRAEERKLADEAMQRLQAAHAEEVERVRNEAAGEAMQRLTDVLLGMDAEGGSHPVLMRPLTPPENDTLATVEQEQETAAVSDIAPEEEEVLAFDEPWIDTPLCTSCNDCLPINPQLFIYNEEKQAMLGDLGSATFAQLVQAAEICPAKCIHPGKPSNPDEPDLDLLIERAAPFNQ